VNFLPTDLESVVAAVIIESATVFHFSDQRIEIEPPASPFAAPEPPLLPRLQGKLYRYAYCRHFDPPLVPPTPVGESDRELVAALSLANAGRDQWQAGWRVVAVGDTVRIQRGAEQRIVPHGEIRIPALSGTGGLPTPGSGVELRRPREGRRIQPGYYFAFGGGRGTEGLRRVRFYWHLTPRGAVDLMGYLTPLLHRFSVPFQLKCPDHPDLYDRRDTAVLIVDHRQARIASELIAEALPLLLPNMVDDVPLWTRRMAPGLGFAEDPGGGASFGMHRCGLLAGALWQAHVAGVKDPGEQLVMVEETFRRSGIDLRQPHLRGGVDYTFPAFEGDGSPRPSAHSRNRTTGRGEEFLEAAEHIGGLLVRDALWHQDRCNWLGWSQEGTLRESRMVYRSFGPNLYSGTSGIGLFLARLYRATGDPLFAGTAVGALNQALASLESEPRPLPPGFYAGSLGVAFCLVEGGEILERPDWVERGLKLAATPQDETVGVAEQEALDVIRGSAGAVAPLLSLARRYPDHPRQDHLWTLLQRHGRHLLRHARPRPGGLAWPLQPGDEPPELTGYAHGAAGVALALAELANAGERIPAEDRKAFHAAAREGLGYERALFIPNPDGKGGNWPDLRVAGHRDGAPRAMVAWCHGAAGIALARMRYQELEPEDEETPREIQDALQTVVAQLSRPLLQGSPETEGPDFSLCHGAAGLAECLLEAHRHQRRESYGTAAREVGRFGITTFLDRQCCFPCGTGGGEAPGLLLGLAGIGHFYLRLAREEPSLLLIRP
jgi:hypothetical protein